MAGLKPFVFVDQRCKRKLILPPCHDIPGERFIGRPALRLKGKRVTSLAEDLRRNEGALRMALLRVRAALRACVEKSLVAGGDMA